MRPVFLNSANINQLSQILKKTLFLNFASSKKQ